MRGVRSGADVLLEGKCELLQGRRVGLITNQTGVTKGLEPLARALAKEKRWEMAALFGPEHGYSGFAPDAESVGFAEDKASGLPIYSLFGKTQKPTGEMLEGIDTLVFDIQDVGVRFYTYAQTMSLSMEAASEKGIGFVVLDRPNPLTGVTVEGNVLDPTFSSFLGGHPIALRHGMTVGELANLFNREFHVSADLSVVKMKGWKREMWHDETGLVWVPPSPGIPSLRTATVYPGMCLLEGTSLSEGRGTCLPFEVAGAPWVEGERLANRLRAENFKGCLVRSAEFVATSSKYREQRCGGIQVHVIDRHLFKPIEFGLTLISTVREQYPTQFKWTVDSESQRFHFDLLMGTDKVRRELDACVPVADIVERWKDEILRFKEIRQESLLYRQSIL